MGTPHRKYEPEFKMMVAKKVVLDGMTTFDVDRLYNVDYRRVEDWAIAYIKKGGPDLVTGAKSQEEIQRDKLLLKAVRLEYRIEKMKKEAASFRAQATELDKEIKANKASANS